MLHGPYRVGPWPGLSPSGAAVLLGCALLLSAGEALVGTPRSAVPDLPLVGAVAVVPMTIATRIVRAPGAASAVCGAYLLPWTLLSLAVPGVPLPPLLLVPALGFDLTLWLRRGDLVRLYRAWPGRRTRWRKSARVARDTTLGRVGAAGAVFGVTLSLVEPPFAVLLGADPTGWSGSGLWLAGGLTLAACSVAAPLVMFSGRGTGS
ncbi:MAG TPA: hypothetical protein VF937_01735 [Chloroflexota bacterium]